MITYQIIRSDRRSIAIQIMPDGSIVVRCPHRMPLNDIRRFVESKSAWIEKHQADRRPVDGNKLTERELEELRDRARQYFTDRVEYYAPLIGVTYCKVFIRTQRTRWGSCSSKGNLSFNSLLMLAPEEVRDYVVVHELCHRKEWNHSVRFWDAVSKVMPNYKSSKNWLKENGRSLIARI